MKVFITGASGRIASHVIPHLINRGHTVVGLVRSPTAADKIKALGATPIIGTLSDTDILTAQAKASDGVIHCAMDMSSKDPAHGFNLERSTIELFGDALEGTNKPLIMSSATALLGPGSDEKSSPAVTSVARAGTETILLGLKDRGIRSIAIRMAINTHAIDKIHLFHTFLINAGRQFGFIPYIEGVDWSACHADDAALLFVLALEKAEAGTAAHAVQEFIPVKDIAEAIGKRVGMEAQAIDRERLKELQGFLPVLLTLHQDISTEWTRETYGWDPKGQELLAEFDEASDRYFL